MPTFLRKKSIRVLPYGISAGRRPNLFSIFCVVNACFLYRKRLQNIKKFPPPAGVCIDHHPTVTIIIGTSCVFHQENMQYQRIMLSQQVFWENFTKKMTQSLEAGSAPIRSAVKCFFDIGVRNVFNFFKKYFFDRSKNSYRKNRKS